MKRNWPRIRDLPERDRGPFGKWLSGQSRPVIGGIREDEQDGFFQHDYERWREMVYKGVSTHWD